MKYKYGKEVKATSTATTKKRKTSSVAKNVISGSQKKKDILNQCLKLWAQIIKKKYPACVKCGTTSYLNAHHIFSRRYKSTFLDTENGISFCRGCHLYFAHCFYEEARDIYIRELGKKKYEALKKRSQSITKVTQAWLEEKKVELEEELGS